MSRMNTIFLTKNSYEVVMHLKSLSKDGWGPKWWLFKFTTERAPLKILSARNVGSVTGIKTKGPSLVTKFIGDAE